MSGLELKPQRFSYEWDPTRLFLSRHREYTAEAFPLPEALGELVQTVMDEDRHENKITVITVSKNNWKEWLTEDGTVRHPCPFPL